MNYVIYAMTFSDGSVYVGATKHFASRRASHLRSMRKNTAAKLVQAAFDRCGPPDFREIACATALEDAVRLEALVVTQERPTLNHPDPRPYKAPRAPTAPQKGPRTYKKRAPGPRLVLVDGILAYPKAHRERYGMSLAEYNRLRSDGLDPFASRTAAPMPRRPRNLTVNGRTQTLSEWAWETGLSKQCIARRIDTLGWSPEKAVLTPAGAPGDFLKNAAAKAAEERASTAEG